MLGSLSIIAFLIIVNKNEPTKPTTTTAQQFNCFKYHKIGLIIRINVWNALRATANTRAELAVRIVLQLSDDEGAVKLNCMFSGQWRKHTIPGNMFAIFTVISNLKKMDFTHNRHRHLYITASTSTYIIYACGYDDNIGVHDPNMNGEYYLCMFGYRVEKAS